MRLPIVIAALSLVSAAPVSAALPEPVEAIIRAAIDSGDAKAVATVVDLAKATNPNEVDTIDALYAGFRDEQAKLAAQTRREEEAAIRGAGLFDRWKGSAELGGFRSTGNSELLGLTGSVAIARKGIDWTHKLDLRADLQRSGGRTTRQKYFAAYEPRYDVRDNLFVYGLAQYDRDRFQGYDARYALSGGVGTKLVDSDDIDLSVKAGPALRVTEATDGTTDTRLAGLLGVEFDWALTNRLKFTQTANGVAETGGVAVALIDSRSTTVNLVTGLEARVSDRLSTRFSYALDYDSNPLAGKLGTDTTSRFSLVYGF